MNTYNIKTIKYGDLYLTFDENHDNPNSDNFPSDRVAVGFNKEQSLENYQNKDRIKKEMLEAIQWYREQRR